MPLITDTESLKKANSAIVYDLQFDSISSFVDDASTRDLIPAIGRQTYLILGASNGNAGLQVALQLAQKAEANLALCYYTNFGSVKISEDGAQVYQDGNNKIASDAKISALVNQARLDGYRALDSLLTFIESDIDSFEVYANSPERKNNRSAFINATAEFNEALFIDNNPLLFRSLKSYIADAEDEHIINVLGKDYAKALRAKVLANNCSDIEKDLLKKIAKVVAPFAIAEAIPYQAVSIDRNGTYTNTVNAVTGNNEQKQSPAEVDKLTKAMTALIVIGNKNLSRLRRFINDNQSELTGCSTVDLNSRSRLNDQPRGFFFA